MTSGGAVGGARVVITADLAAFAERTKVGVAEGMKEVGVTVDKALQGIVPLAARAGTAAGEAFGQAASRAAMTSLRQLGVAQDQLVTSTRRSVTARQTDTRATVDNTAAKERLAATITSISGLSAKEQQATLRAAAATERATEVNASATASYRQMASAQATAIGAQSRLAATQGTLATKVESAGKRVSKAITLPFIAATAVAVNQASKFQSATNVYVTAAGETQSNLGIVRNGLKRIAVETGTSLTQLTSAEYIAEKAHLRGAAGIAALDAAAKGAREENANLSDVMQGETSIMASYHLKASDAVSVINALKTGAGSAKVTMEAYVRSLSTVIPVASAAGISLSQLLGAESTLTQHGTTADEAAQELANTIRNLQAPNNVAVAAMNQLGISSVNVASKLGKRGLTGTIDYIASRLPKSGLVYLTTMRQMEAGTADLNAMQAKMPPALAAVSKGFLDGSVTAKTYRSDIKGLGASGYAQGSQFLTLATQVKGYNTSLRNGSPAQKTMAAELKAIFGGATGLNTVLQLGGHNLAGFKDRVASVSQSLHDNSHEVEGWSSTSKLASVQAGQLKESLRVLAINGGNAVLPILLKVAHAGLDIVHGFEGLPHSEKMVLGWSIGIVAALGPVLALGGRVLGFGAKIEQSATRVASLAGASESTAARVGVAMRRVTGAVTGVAVGIAASQIGSDHTGGGWLTSIFLGTAGGWALGGPIGAAVGGVSAAVLKGIGLWNDHKNAAKAAMLEEKAFVDSLTQAIDADNGALGTNVKLTVTKKLQSSGALDLAQKLHLSLAAVADAATGGPGSAAAEAMQRQLGSSQTRTLNRGMTLLQSRGVANGSNVLAGLAGGNKSALSGAVDARGNKIAFSAADAKTLAGIASTAKGYSDLASKLGLVTRSVAASVKADNQKMHTLNDDRVATGSYANQLAALRHHTSLAIDSNGQLTTSLRASTVVGQHNQAALRGVAAAAQVDAEKTLASALAHGKTLPQALQAANANLTSNIGKIRASAVAAGFNKAGVDALTRSYGKIPKSVLTQITKKGLTPSQVQAIIDRLNNIPRDIPISITVTAQTRGNLASTYASQVPLFKAATGTIVRGPGGPTDDRAGVYALSDGEAVIPAKAVSRHPALIRALIGAGRGLASGGVIGALTQMLASIGVGRAGDAGVIGNGIAESGLRTNAANASGHIGLFQWGGGRAQGLRNMAASMGLSWTSLKAQVAYLRKELTGSYRNVLHGLQSAKSPTSAATLFNRLFEVSGDERGVREANARSVYSQLKNVGKGGNYTVGGVSYASQRAATNAITRASQALSRDLPKFNGMVGKSAASITSAGNALVKDLTTLGASRRQLAAVHTDLSKLTSIARNRATLAGRLGTPDKAQAPTAYQRLATAQTNYNDEKSTVTQAQLSGFDPFTAGQGFGGFSLAQSSTALAGQSAVLSKRKAELAKLHREGISGALYKQLAEGGPAADSLLAALSGASKSTALGYQKQFNQVQSLAGQVGTTAANSIDGQALQAAKDTVAQLKRQIAADDARSRALIHSVDNVAAAVRGGKHHAAGGWTTGVGGPTSDNQLEWHSPGEFTVNATAARRHGPLLEAINEGKLSSVGRSIRVTPVTQATTPIDLSELRSELAAMRATLSTLPGEMSGAVSSGMKGEARSGAHLGRNQPVGRRY